MLIVCLTTTRAYPSPCYNRMANELSLEEFLALRLSCVCVCVCVEFYKNSVCTCKFNDLDSVARKILPLTVPFNGQPAHFRKK